MKQAIIVSARGTEGEKVLGRFWHGLAENFKLDGKGQELRRQRTFIGTLIDVEMKRQMTEWCVTRMRR